MATITIVQARFLRNAYGIGSITRGGPEAPNFKETAGQTFLAGAPLYKDSNGTIAVATASSNIVNAGLCGFALAPASGVTGTQVRYRPIMPGDIYVMNLKGTSTTVTALTQLGTNTTGIGLTMFDLSSGLLVANPDATFNAAKPYGKILDLYTIVAGYQDGDVVGDTNGRLVIQFDAQAGILP